VDPVNYLTITKGTEEPKIKSSGKSSMLATCEYNFSGKDCEQCAPGFYSEHCHPCPIDPSTKYI
jgi:hypothetical protein